MRTTLNRSVWGGLSALCGLAMMYGCASTEMSNTWFDPAAMGSPLQKVAVVVLTKDAGMRRVAETEAVKQFKRNAPVQPSYLVLSDSDLRHRETVKSKLRDQGFDGVLIMRLASINEQTTVVGVGPAASFDGYYDWASASVYAPGYLETDTVVTMVSNLYSLTGDKLVWSGTSKTFDPGSAKKEVRDASKAVAKSIEKDRLIL